MDRDSKPDVVIRAGRREDLIALLAIRLGFRPTESLLAGSLDGPRSRLGFVARVDLPDPPHRRQQVGALVEAFRRQRVEQVVVVAVGRGHDLGALVDVTVEAFAVAGIEVAEALVADGQRWWCRLCAGCGDPAGSPYDLTSSPALVQAVLAGVSVLPSREALADGFAAVRGPQRSAVSAAVERVQADLQRRWHRYGTERPLHRTPAVLTEAADRVRRLCSAAMQPDRLDAQHTAVRLMSEEMAELAVLADLTPVRDVAWALITHASAREHAELWAQVARHAPGELSAAPLALAGFASWLHGDGAAAWCAVERCLREHPGYSMCLLLAEALHRALPPGAWSPPPADLLAAGLDPPVELDGPPAA